MNIFKKIRAALRYNEAVRQADKEHRETGERYYVMPNGNGKLIIMDRSNFRRLKHKHYISHKCSVRDLESECFYCTPYRNGKGELSKEVRYLKRQQCINFVFREK